MGIKGPVLITKKVHAPNGIPLESLHLRDLGQFKRFMRLFFDSTISEEKFYIGILIGTV